MKTRLTILLLFCAALASCAGFFSTTVGKPKETGKPSSSGQTGTGQTSTGQTGTGQGQTTANTPKDDSKEWNLKLVDTARDAAYLSAIEKDVILEMNKVRSDPKKYAELYLQPRLQYYNGKYYSVPGKISMVTQEGAAALNACIATLKKAGSVGVLAPEKGLSLGAKDHVKDQSKTGAIGHDGSDRSTPETRIRRYGKFGSGYTWGENISYGDSTGRDIVCSLLIDDGVPDRGHLKNIMNKNFTQTGVGYGTHTKYRTMCVIPYAKGYISN